MIRGPIATALGLLLVSVVLFVGSAVARSAPARAASPAQAATPTCPTPPGSPCQAFFYIDKATGRVTQAVPLMGGNVEGQDYDGVECHGAGAGKCFLAADTSGFALLNLNATDCNASSNETRLTPIGGASSFVVAGLAWDQATQKLYAISSAGQLVTVDTANGATTAVGPGGLNAGSVGGLSAMAWDPASGEFYAVRDMGTNPYQLIKVSPATGTIDPTYVPISIANDTAGGHTRNETLGITIVNATMYAAMTDSGDANPNLATIDPTTGATTDIGSLGVDWVGGLSSDSSGVLYGIAGTRGANISPYPCPSPSPSPSPTPSPSPSPTPPPSPSPSATPPGPTPSPSTSVLGGGFVRSPAPSPTTSVLGVNITRKPGLPVTGLNVLPLVLLAAMCYLFGAVALTFSSKGMPHGLRASLAGFWANWFLGGARDAGNPGDSGDGGSD